MALASVVTEPKTTSKTKTPILKKTKTKSKITKPVLIDTLLTPTNPYELLSERINSLDTKIDATKNELSERITSVDRKIDSVKNELSAQINAVEKNLSARIDGTEKSLTTRVDSFEKSMSRSFTMLTIVMAFVGLGLALLQIVGI